MALTATAFNYVILPTDGAPSRGPTPGKYRIENKQRIVRVRAVLNNASDAAAYPTSGGIPLSTTPSDWGMIRNLDYVIFQGVGARLVTVGLANASVGDAPVWHYNVEGHSMQGYTSPTALASSLIGAAELSTQWTPTLSADHPIFYFEAHGW